MVCKQKKAACKCLQAAECNVQMVLFKIVGRFAIGFIQSAFGDLGIDAHFGTDFLLDFVGDFRVFFQPHAGVVFALANLVAIVAVPCA